MLFLIFLLSLLTLAGAWKWDSWQNNLAEKQFAAEWQDDATGMAQQFKANCSIEAQMRSSFQRTCEKILKSSAPLRQNTASIRQAFDESLPAGWFPDAMLYAFDFSTTEGKCLSGPGLARLNGSFLARIFASLNRWGDLGGSERKKIDSRIENLFGERMTGEMLLDNRFGKGIDVVFNGERCVVFWDFFYAGGKIPGAFLLVSRSKPADESAALLALARIAAESDFATVPLLMPLESLTAELRPLIPEDSRGALPLNHLFANLAATRNYDQIASFSLGTMLEQVVVMRSVFGRSLPYELWLVASRPEARPPEVFLLTLFLLIFSWAAVVFLRIRAGIPFVFSVQARLLGLILVVGGGPVLLLVSAGVSVIEQDHHARYRGMIDAMRSEMSQIDGNSTSLRLVFENNARRMMNNSAFKEALLDFSTGDATPAFAGCFRMFAADGVPLNGIGILNFGHGDRMVFPEGFSGSRDTSRLFFFSPMIYAGLKHFASSDYERAIKVLSESQRLGYDTYQLITNASSLGGVALARQKSFLMEFGQINNYVFYDYISDGKSISAAVIFLARSSDAYLGFARQSIARARAFAPERRWGFAEKRDDGFGIVAPKGQGRGKGDTWFYRNLSRAHGASAFRVEKWQNELQVCLPCEHMRGVTLGCSMSLAALNARTRQQYQVLASGAILLLLVLGLVAAGAMSYFLAPLKVIEGGITRILDRQFGFKLSLNRDDELGDVANAFDNMAQGLHERHELAQFVSGSLSTRLNEVTDVRKPHEEKWGVILASDIRSFTTLSETYAPEEIVRMLNRHLELMSNEIIAGHGEIDKFIGDAVVAAFFAEDRYTACANAVAAARKMMVQHRRFVAERVERGEFGYGMGIGIDCGNLLIGSFGAGDRHEYSMSGEARHRAEQLEAETRKGHHTFIIISSEVSSILPEMKCVPVEGSSGFEVIES